MGIRKFAAATACSTCGKESRVGILADGARVTTDGEVRSRASRQMSHRKPRRRRNSRGGQSFAKSASAKVGHFGTFWDIALMSEEWCVRRPDYSIVKERSSIHPGAL